MEKDDEVKGEGNSYTTEFRQYDPRIGRWLTNDPLFKQMPWQSPYVGMDNKPIIRNDVNGDCPTCISGFIIGGLMDMAFQIGEHMFEGDDLGAAFEKVDWLDVTGSAVVGGVVGAFDGGISKFASALADPKKRKILNKVIEYGLDFLIEEAVQAGYDVGNVEEKIYGLLGKDRLGNKAIGDLGEDAARDLLSKKYKDSGVEIVEQAQGKFKDGKRVIFDFLVVDKETGDIIEIVESKANGAKLSPNQKRFFEGGESLELMGKRAQEAGLIGDKKNPKKVELSTTKVKSSIVKSKVNKFTGKTKVLGKKSFFKRLFKK